MVSLLDSKYAFHYTVLALFVPYTYTAWPVAGSRHSDMVQSYTINTGNREDIPTEIWCL